MQFRYLCSGSHFLVKPYMADLDSLRDCGHARDYVEM
jgi:GDP-D-mannose dehydratase